MNVGMVIALAGLLACALLMIVLSFAEAAHPRRPARSREPVIEAPAPPPEPQHGVHGPAVVLPPPPPEPLPPGRNNTLDVANWIAARSHSWHPAYYMAGQFGMSPALLDAATKSVAPRSRRSSS